MTSRIPVLNAQSEESIRDWYCCMQELQGEAMEEIAGLLDKCTDSAALVGALTDYLAAYNIGEDDQLLVRAIESGVDFENNNSGDGCTISRQNDKWWLDSTEIVDFGAPTSAEAQHEEVAGQVIYYMWWGNLENVETIMQMKFSELGD